MYELWLHQNPTLGHYVPITWNVCTLAESTYIFTLYMYMYVCDSASDIWTEQILSVRFAR